MENQHYSHRIEIIYSCSNCFMSNDDLCKEHPPSNPQDVLPQWGKRGQLCHCRVAYTCHWSCVKVPRPRAFNGSTVWSWCIGWYLNGLSDQMFRLVLRTWKTWKHQTWLFHYSSSRHTNWYILVWCWTRSRPLTYLGWSLPMTWLACPSSQSGSLSWCCLVAVLHAGGTWHKGWSEIKRSSFMLFWRVWLIFVLYETAWKRKQADVRNVESTLLEV